MQRILLAIAMTVATAASAAPPLTLDRIFGSPALSGVAPREVRLSPDGSLATLLRNRPDDRDRYDLWGIDTTTGKSRMLVDSLKVGSGAAVSEEEKMRRERARIGGTKGITGYGWAPDGRSILVPLDGDLFLAALDGNVRRLTNTPETELDAQVSAGGGFVSFVRDHNLYVIDLASGTERKLTPDGGGTVTWGSAEFVAQEEMARMTGHWWAHGDRLLAVERYDEAQVPAVTRASIGADGAKLFEQRYPAAGTHNVAVQLWVMAPDGSRRVRVDLGADPDIYLARVAWAPDGSTLYVQRENRAQTQLDLLAVDPATGASHVLLSESGKDWINLNDDFRVLRDGSLIWGSERSGFAHLYRWRAGALIAITSGDWPVKKLVAVDEAKGLVYFLANRDDPIGQQLYRVAIAGGVPERVSDTGWWSDVAMDARGGRALVTRSGPSQPTQVYLADADGKRLAWIEENKVAGEHPLAPYLPGFVAPQFGTLHAADGSVLHTKLLRPAGAGRHPVLVQVYNGPGAGRQVTEQWSSRDSVLHQYLVSKGWIVFSIDGRGSPDRGHAFESQIHRAMGTVEVQDQLAGLAWLKAQPFVDPRRIAVYGWSYGGYMVLKLLEAAPGAYAAGISGAPVTRWELYDTHYTERYLGNPATDPAPYHASDAVPGAAKIADPLLMLHGMADDNVVFDNGTAMYAALQAAGVPFEQMVYPGQTHAFTTPAQRHVWRTIESFLDRRVKALPGS
ncbi:S9 family peptidase [Sphingomonas nostoxanthinifaciens]|uniref:S9 family peptidase n=1 Tax=Sphingomonas nostoxanthinifaciens TaxID=2872652 RepID=UPI001CC1FE98|nr:S9 family peptidase [Sphingomonas nostoxanthinifaciens]UAK25266.1 S9 family peptidase [Sphingomonas nostoxanthinifaciens]